jgi:hypothetical protein
VISLDDYVGPHADSPDWTPERKAAAFTMLEKSNALLADAEAHGVELEDNPKTGSLVSGEKYGGFRPQDCPQGAPHSAHKEGRGVDVYDPTGALDRWISDLILEKYGLYREHPADTGGWCHLTDRAPPSGRRTFHP